MKFKNALPIMNELGLVIIATENYILANNALINTINEINPKHVLTYTDHSELWNEYDKKLIPKINTIDDYNEIILKNLAEHIFLNHYLVIQYDGFVINNNKFDASFLKYDYIGAPWPQFSYRNVGNGGFSLRSKKLIEASKELAIYRRHNEAEDIFLCRSVAEQLENKYNIRFAQENIAKIFSYESPTHERDTFGFHGLLNLPIVYKDNLNFLFDNLDSSKLSRKSELLYGLLNCNNFEAEKFIKMLTK